MCPNYPKLLEATEPRGDLGCLWSCDLPLNCFLILRFFIGQLDSNWHFWGRWGKWGKWGKWHPADSPLVVSAKAAVGRLESTSTPFQGHVMLWWAALPTAHTVYAKLDYRCSLCKERSILSKERRFRPFEFSKFSKFWKFSKFSQRVQLGDGQLLVNNYPPS